MRGPELADDLSDDVGEIGGLPGDPDPAALAAANEIEQVADHPLHPVGGARDATQAAYPGRRRVALTQLRARREHDGVERVAQIVREHAHEALAEHRVLSQRLLHFYQPGDVLHDHAY